MARFYALQVVMGKITLDEVPDKYRDKVVKILEAMS